MIELIVPGEPMGKQRPRMSTRTGKAYTPKKTVLYENWVKECYCISKDKKHLTGAIKAHIKVYMSIPKSTSKKKRQEMISEKIRPTKKPDLDNIAKIILDSLNGLAYEDDKQIVSLQVNKFYGTEPKVIVQLEEV
ncbi:RusA family crossover junction endodeoxyribonuclease [Clostridium botulinum]|uniref:RusA family crossover junction endodeoxyribonuclease n=1 Tax=Clostridium botulinum TaxID=1491 RepID=UPI0004D6DFFF|nr:RusA family crossover junction endodeoxyribonuclease [Clostridium botulinum]KEH90599.1 endonuclease [Clostridium botulinum C/D str. It1]